MGGDENSDSIATENEYLNGAIKVMKQCFPFILVYFLGYFDCSVLWNPVILAIMLYTSYRRNKKRERLRVRRAIALGHEQEVIWNTISEFPFWVKFQEKEQAEWLNTFFKQVWRQINKYARSLVSQIVEPAVQVHVSDFKFGEVLLGNVPLRVDGVKVYDQQDPRKVVMDLDISYAGDCYVTFQTFRFTGGIKDIQLYGRLRVVLTPLLSKFPIVGGIQVYFTSPPRIDFELIKIAQFLEIPGVRGKIMSTTMKVINSMFLYPNAYSINLSQNINMSKIHTFTTEGILRVHVVEARDLVNKDIIGKSDPYVVLKIGNISVETPVIQNNLNPRWDFWHEFEVDSNSEINLEVWDKDACSRDDPLGYVKFEMANVVKIRDNDMWIPLQGVAKGTIHLGLTWLSLSKDYADLEATIKETQLLSSNLHTCLLMIYLESSLNLAMVNQNLPNPYVELEIEGIVAKSDVEMATCAPVWNKGFSFLIRDPKKAVLNIRVIDDTYEDPLGVIFFKIDHLKNESKLELKRHTFFFNEPYAEASICCSMKLRILKNEYVKETNHDDTKPGKVLKKQDSSFSVKSTKSEVSESSTASTNSGSSISDISDNTVEMLRNIKISISYDNNKQRLLVQIHELQLLKPVTCYVKVYLHKDNQDTDKKRTKVIKNCSSPTFDEQFDYAISTEDLACTQLVITAEAEQRFFNLRRKFLGRTIIALTKCDSLTELFTGTFYLKSKKDTDVCYLTRE